MCNQSEIINTIHYIFLVTCSLSVFSCLSIIIVYYIHKDYRGISLKIVLCMSITDLISSLFYYLPIYYLGNPLICKITAVTTNLCLKIDILWSMCIVCTLKEVLGNVQFKPETYLRKWYFCAFIVLPIFQTLPLITDSFGENFGVCSYKNDLGGILWRLVGDSFIFAGIAYTVFGYFKIHLNVKDFNLFSIKQLIFENGLIYSFILIVIVVPAVLLRYIEYFEGFCEVYYYSYIAYISFSLQGFMNFCALLSNRNIRRSIKMIITGTSSFNESDFIKDILNESSSSEIIPSLINKCKLYKIKIRNNNCMCDEQDLINSILLMSLICSVVSVVFCLIIVALYVRIRQRGGLSFHILLYMSITDMVRSACLIMTYIQRENVYICKITAVLVNSSLFTNSIWSVYIIFVLHRICLNFPIGSEFYLKTWTICGFILPTVLHLFPLITDSYGFNEGSCTYKDDFYGIIWRAISEFSMFFIVVVAIVGYLKVYKGFKDFTLRQVVFEKGMIYSILFLVTFVVLILFRFLAFFLGFCKVYPFAFLSYCLVSLNGFLNFLALTANKSFWDELWKIVKLQGAKSDSFDYFQTIISS